MPRKTPSFKDLHPASELSSRVKRKNRKTDTLHELALRRELWNLGLRYRKNVVSLPGKPDIVFSRARVVVFCDGDFWHGRHWKKLKSKLIHGANPSYWIRKIASNIQRDKRITASLRKLGWHVIRLWETDIRKDPSNYALMIKKIIDEREMKL